jgi:alcohol dehydrogenase class IV
MAVRSLKITLIRLRKQLGLPASLKDAGVDVGKLSADIPAICKAVLADACIATNPVPVTEKDIVNILQQVSGRG